ncbi:MAG TPA: ABC transporter ATP-binding protein [Candidatus Dormibacteraeota bacterium]|nr:ABC transporter ATP-binding protein [Candidatus Dormibacteraeota bacterium]
MAKYYRTAAGQVQAVAGVDLEVEAGTSVAIVGPSGCGKSTLLGLLGGLEKPTRGEIWLGEVEVARLSEAGRARLRRDEIGFVFQSYDLLPFLSAYENISFQLALRGAPDGERGCKELLDGLGLAEHADKLPDQLSGGQRQRVGIARALVHRPRLILADEPTGELDSQSAASAMDLLIDAQRAIGATMVVVTHDMGVAGRLDRIVRLRDGRVALEHAVA